MLLNIFHVLLTNAIIYPYTNVEQTALNSVITLKANLTSPRRLASGMMVDDDSCDDMIAVMAVDDDRVGMRGQVAMANGKV
jgi:hypothetical protein